MVDAAVFVLLGWLQGSCVTVNGSQCRLIGTMVVVVNFLDGLGRTQVIYTTLIALFPGPVIRGDQHRCGRTSAYAQFCSSKSN